MPSMQFQNRIVHPELPIKDLLAIFQKNPSKFIYVVNPSKILLGLISEGDLRRFFIKSDSFDYVASDVMINKFTFIRADFYAQDVNENLLFLQKHKECPIINNDGTLLSIEEPLNRQFIPIAMPDISGSEREELLAVFNSTFISSNSKAVETFEKGFLKFLDQKFGTSVSNGTVALELALKSLGFEKDSKIGVPNYSFGATINAVINCGFEPVLIDCGKNLLMDLTHLAKINNLSGLIYVSLYGYANNIKEVSDYCSNNGVLLIEDNAEGLGTSINNTKLGKFGNASTYSFFANKLITTGEGGFVTFKNEEDYKKSLLIKNHGMSVDRKYFHEVVGNNYRMTGLQAAIGIGQLKRIDYFLERRNNIGKRYDKELCISKKYLKVSPGRDNFNSYWLYPIVILDNMEKIDLFERFNSLSIELREIFIPFHEMEIFGSYKIKNFEYSTFEGLVLPTYPLLKDDDISLIIETINIWAKK
jgi:perosamine synthetase